MRKLLLALSLLLPVSVLAQPVAVQGNVPVLPFPTGKVETLNILQWDTNSLPKIFQRSEQLPLTDEDLAKLSKAGFKPAQLVKMIEERRCACDASADGLIRLKEQGVSEEVLAAVSFHGLKPHRALNLLVTLDVASPAVSPNQVHARALKVPRQGFLYFFIDDGKLTRVLSVNLADLAGRRYRNEAQVDRSDLLLEKAVRRLEFFGQIPLTTYGAHTVMVVSSGNPALTHPSQLSAAERAGAQLYNLDYPRSSLQNICRLTAGYKQDIMLAHKWNFAGSRFECEWD